MARVGREWGGYDIPCDVLHFLARRWTLLGSDRGQEILVTTAKGSGK
jgi:hypothetical protein